MALIFAILVLYFSVLCLFLSQERTPISNSYKKIVKIFSMYFLTLIPWNTIAYTGISSESTKILSMKKLLEWKCNMCIWTNAESTLRKPNLLWRLSWLLLLFLFLSFLELIWNFQEKLFIRNPYNYIAIKLKKISFHKFSQIIPSELKVLKILNESASLYGNFF